jgi:hypothetical protein
MLYIGAFDEDLLCSVDKTAWDMIFVEDELPNCIMEAKPLPLETPTGVNRCSVIKLSFD